MNNRPLASLKILDFSTLLPGPYATLMLADMGAEVLRVESPTRPDLVKSLPPTIDGNSAAHHYLNRNKQSLALDLKQSEAVEMVKKLIGEYDIVVEQFRPGVMARLGLDYQTLKAINPKLIYCSITGYGQTGPYQNRAGHDLNYLAIAGASSYTGRKESGPLPLGVQLADVAGGSHHAVMGILAAHIQRQHSGIGQHIDISMTDAAFALNGMSGAGSLASGEDSQAEQDWLNGGSFYDYYETKDGRYLSVAGLEPAFVKNLADTLDEPKLLKLVNMMDTDMQQELKALLKGRFAEHTFDYWCEVFADRDCCVEPMLTINESANHPHMQAREMVINYQTDKQSTIRQAACPIKFSASKQATPTVAPATGEHNQQVLERL
ncbi:MAG: CaiB/BaiF CoA-transferase family protein [Bermanella sp.]